MSLAILPTDLIINIFQYNPENLIDALAGRTVEDPDQVVPYMPTSPEVWVRLLRGTTFRPPHIRYMELDGAHDPELRDLLSQFQIDWCVIRTCKNDHCLPHASVLYLEKVVCKPNNIPRAHIQHLCVHANSAEHRAHADAIEGATAVSKGIRIGDALDEHEYLADCKYLHRWKRGTMSNELIPRQERNRDLIVDELHTLGTTYPFIHEGGHSVRCGAKFRSMDTYVHVEMISLDVRRHIKTMMQRSKRVHVRAQKLLYAHLHEFKNLLKQDVSGQTVFVHPYDLGADGKSAQEKIDDALSVANTVVLKKFQDLSGVDTSDERVKIARN